MKISIVVASATGRTRRMGEAFQTGAEAAGADAALRSAEEAVDADLVDADVIALGSGVHMGGIESSMRALFERSAPLWMQGRLVGKLGAAFVSAGDGGRGGGELALLSLHAFLAQNGMLLVPLHPRLEGFGAAGSHWGSLAETQSRGAPPGPTEAQLACVRAQGQWVAECAQRWRAPEPPAR